MNYLKKSFESWSTWAIRHHIAFVQIKARRVRQCAHDAGEGMGVDPISDRSFHLYSACDLPNLRSSHYGTVEWRMATLEPKKRTCHCAPASARARRSKRRIRIGRASEITCEAISPNACDHFGFDHVGFNLIIGESPPNLTHSQLRTIRY